MPRRTRMYRAALPYHIVQRGNNCDACFIEPENYQFYLNVWQQVSQRYQMQRARPWVSTKEVIKA